MKYPKRFKSKINGAVIEFTGPDSGFVIEEGRGVYDVGHNTDKWVPHTNTYVWEEVKMTELETLKQQVTEMQETIARMEKETVQVKQWEPQSGEYVIYGHSIGISRSGCNYKKYSDFGLEYQTKEQAEWASKQMRKFNRLLCYVVEHTEGIPGDIVINPTSGYNHVNAQVPLIPSNRLILSDKIQSGEVVL